MDASKIDIDNFNFEQPHNYALINNVLMDRNLMGNRIQGVTAYAVARNSARYGYTTCAICGVAYSNQNIKLATNHIRSKRHKDAADGKLPVQKRPRKVH